MKIKKLILFLFVLIAASVLRSGAYFRTSPENTSHFNYIMGRLKLREGRIREGLERLERAAKLDPESSAVRYDLIELYYLMGNNSEARITGEELLVLKPRDTDLMELMAEIYNRLDEKERAVEMLEKIIELEKDNVKAKTRLAAHLKVAGRHKEALRLYKSALEVKPGDSSILLSIAALYRDMEKYSAALRTYSRAAGEGAEKREVNLQRSRIYSDTGKYLKAEEALKKNIEKDSRDIQSLYLLADIYRSWGKHEKSEEVYKNLLELTDNEYGIKIGLGAVYIEANMEEKAKEVFRNITREHPEEFLGWYLLGLSKLFGSDYAGALEAFKEGAEIDQTAELYFNMGVAADKLDRDSDSYRFFEKSIELDPEYHLALNYLGYSWADKGINLDAAEEYIKRALKIKPGKAAYIDSLGWVFYRQGRYREAFTKLERAARLERDPIIFKHLGDVYLKLGKSNAAERIYREALRMDPEKEDIIERLENLTR